MRVERHGHGSSAAVAAHDVGHAIEGQRGWDWVCRHAAELPDLLAVGQVVRADAIRAVDDYLRSSAMLDHKRCAPGRFLVAFHFPAGLSRGGIQHDQFRVGLLVPVQDDRIAMDDGSDRLTPDEPGVQPAEVVGPEQPAGKIVCVNTK